MKNIRTTGSSYTKGNLRLVDKGNGRMALEPITIDDAAALNTAIDTLAETIDTSGLRLSDEPRIKNDNPYDTGSAITKAAKHWHDVSVHEPD